ncbi:MULTISPECIES: helix-turn-helix transcriptional regulator [unclassified Roseovarius]|uniref:helix-turn-helix transcriptional regulator n=1 Tax=unclassified Roseovarius TaxID=2614913 RepID=UPI0027400BF4|nr:hypothetical protein [Roseovarius sp. MMSF_3350]
MKNPADATEKPTAPLEPLTIRPGELAARMGVSLAWINQLRNHPNPEVRLPRSFKIGRAVFWRIEDVNEWLDRQARRNAA